MNSTKLGLRITSSVLATALATTVGIAPVREAMAAPPEDEAASADGDSEEEGDAPEEGDGEEGEPAAEGEEGEEGEPAAEEEGDAPEEEGELPEAEEVEAEEAESEPPPPEFEAPLRPPEPTWGPKDQFPMTGKGMLITGGVVTGLGAAFILTSVLITACDFDSALSCKYGNQRDFLVPTAVATTGLGLLLLGVGVGNKVKYKKWERWEPEKAAVVPTMVPGGGGVAMVGRF